MSSAEYFRETASAEDTKQFAATLSSVLQTRDVVLLSGDLGAGKTQFVQGVARGFGIDEKAVTSPTFNILLSYYGKDGSALHHFDLYRLDTPEELEDIGYFETIENGGVVFIEWAEKFPEEMPDDYLEITITVYDDQSRYIAVSAQGNRSCELLRAWTKDTESQMRPCCIS